MIKYWLHSLCCTIYFVVYFPPSSLYRLMPFPILPYVPPLNLLVTTSLSTICESVSVLLYSFALIFNILYISENIPFSLFNSFQAYLSNVCYSRTYRVVSCHLLTNYIELDTARKFMSKESFPFFGKKRVRHGMKRNLF